MRIGLTELLVIGIVLLALFDPKKLKQLTSKITSATKDVTDAKETIEEEVIKPVAEPIKDVVNQTIQPVKDEIEPVINSANEIRDSITTIGKEGK